MNSAEDMGMQDYCTCGHYADWHFLADTGHFLCRATTCSCPHFVPASGTPAVPEHNDGQETT